MLTKEAIAFSRLGRLWQEVAATFADTVTDADTLSLIQQGLQQGLGRRITKIVGVTKDESGTFKGEFRQYISPRLTKRFSFIYGENQLSFKPLNGDDIEKFSEEIEDFARQSKSGRAGKSLNCKVEQCGGRCLRNGESCRLTPTDSQRKLWSQASGKNLATKPETSLAKKRREAKEARVAEAKAKEVAKTKEKRPRKPREKKPDSPSYKVDRSNPSELVKLGAEFSAKHLKLNEIPPSAKENKLLEEKMALGKAMVSARESGDMKTVAELAPKFFAKEDAYFKLQNKRLDEMDAQYEPLREAIIKKHGVTREQAQKAIEKISFDDTLGTDKAKVREDFANFYMLTGGKGFKDLDQIDKTQKRAYANRAGRINVGYDVNSRTNLHELGHHVEFDSDKVGEASVKWRNNRATSTNLEPLNKLSPGGKYDEDEVALPGKFVSPYVGKVYDSRTTEVVSMGLEYFTNPRSMKEFREKDEEHFNYIVGVLLSED